MTMRLRVILGFAIVAVGILLASLQIASVLHDTHAAEKEVGGKWAPATTAAEQLLAHLVDQETGERGYVITANSGFLTPYTEGRQAAAQDLARIRAFVGDDPTVASDLTAVDDQWRRWLTEVAQPEIAAVEAGDLSRAQRLVGSAVGQTMFDTLRTKTATLLSDISLRAAQQEAIENAAITRLDRAFLATLIIGGVFTVLFLFFVQLWILRPLLALQDQLRRAAAGAFREPIEQAGPPELREVASDVESLRTRLVRELERSESVRQALEQRGPVVLGLSDRLRLADAPPIPGLRIASALHAAEGVVAGDLLDVVAIDERRVAVVVADVSGHGAVAGLEAVTLKQVIGTALRLGKDPAAAFDVAADHVRLDERFATCAIVVIDTATGELAYANAGHLPPLVVPDTGHHGLAIQPSQLRQLQPTGPLLSVLARGWEVGHDELRPGEVLLLLTDGLLEARSAAGEEFGVEGLCDALSRAAVRDVDTTVRALTAAARAHADDYSRDDVTVLAVMRDLTTAPSEADSQGAELGRLTPADG
ncbi:MAG TPA: SpoIIE family protein phosphatase [Acidothermaceae bacterium]|jgi:sigma-B regulation protein RsbU (phosphoserine phosphatase)